MLHDTNETEPTPEDVAILALARGRTQTEAANEAGVHRTTVHRWTRDEEFRTRVADARRDILTQATSKLGDRILAAIDALADLLQSESEQTKLGAAKALLSSLLPLNMQTNLEERMTALEAAR